MLYLCKALLYALINSQLLTFRLSALIEEYWDQLVQSNENSMTPLIRALVAEAFSDCEEAEYSFQGTVDADLEVK